MIEEITSPPFLDDTAQEMVTKLQTIANNINNNAGQVSYSNTTSQLQAETVQTAIDEVKDITDNINSSLTQNTYSQTGLTTHSNVSIVSGGYIVVGKIVIVNIRTSITGTIASYSELIKGLPTPVNLNSTNYIAVSTFSGDGAYINSSGNLQNTQQMASGNNVFSCVYVKA